MGSGLNNALAQALAEAAERIYDERYRIEFEREHHGKFVAIDPETGMAYVGDSDTEALQKARSEAPDHLCYLIRVGFAAAYQML